MRIQNRRFVLPLMIVVAALSGPAAAAEGATGSTNPVAADRVAALARLQPLSRAAHAAPDRRCTADGAACIGAASYIPDVCRTIETAAAANALDPSFFARRIWRESLFDAGAVSPAGAEGIAQFMPDTARLRGLADAFNPAEALHASARSLADHARAYGNVGLAAVAYNGGEARAERFVAGTGGLPLETRAYVSAITGHTAETWRDAPPATLDLALAPGTGFQAACVAHAATRGRGKGPDAPPLLPWGVVVASNRDRDGAERQVARLQNRHAAVLHDEPVAFTRTRLRGMPRSLHYAQIGRASRAEADALCARLRAGGGDCLVLRN